MGAWDVLKKMIVGEPIFDQQNKQKNDWDVDQNPTADFAEERDAKREKIENQKIIAKEQQSNLNSLHDSRGYKKIPQCEVIRTRSVMSGKNMDVWATIYNPSERPLELDKILVMGNKLELDYPLQSRSQREFRIFRGVRPKHESYKKAELYYKDIPTGDYFRADHLIDYKQEKDGTVTVRALEFISPVVDV